MTSFHHFDYGDAFRPNGQLVASFEGVEFVRFREWPSRASEATKLLAASPYATAQRYSVEEASDSSEDEALEALALTATAAEELPERIIGILSEVAEDAMTLDSELADGIDSLSSTLVLNNIQMQLGVHISVTEWMEMERVSDVVNRVMQELPATSQPRKPRRQKVERQLPVAPVEVAPVEVAPVEVSEKVMAILNEVADEDEALCLDSALMDGIDSLGSTLVINNIQASFGVHMTVTDWMDMQTARDLTSFVEKLAVQAAPVAEPVRSPKKPRQRKPAKEKAPVAMQHSASVSGLRVLRQGIGPRVFLVDAHPPEAEELADQEKVRERRAELAAALAPCTVCSLSFDEEACRCRNLAELVRLYTRRVNAHRAPLAEAEGEPVALAGWSFSCSIAAALASALEKSGVPDVRLILFEDALLLPPREAQADEWRGGAAEAVLFAACAVGASDWAQKERLRLRGGFPDQEAVEDMQMRLFWEEGAKPGHLQRLGPKRFMELANATGWKVEVLRNLARGSLNDIEGRVTMVSEQSEKPPAARHVRQLS